jgi:hypothetical protein
MNPSSAVFASVVIITGTTIIRRMREAGKQPPRVMEAVVFGFILLIALLTLAIVMPSVAKILAYLGMVGAFVVNGPAVFTLLGNFGRVQKVGP